ncbi:hypothetical protein ACQXR1_11400 [Bacillus sp. ATD]|uniref:hypothetical protein n=1 Tax=Bacillus sp. ATD TaxID=3422305 RepID=UPI003D35412F
MTETNANASANIHVLADETLGGIKREYVEVGRDISARSMGRYVQFTETPNLEPTDIVHIDGPDGTTQRYALTDRKAEVGEKVIITRKLDCCMLDMKIGCIYEVVRLVEGSHGDVNVIDDTDEEATASFGGYRVLVPVETESDEPQPADLIDVVSNLATRVADLERTIKHQKDEIDTLHKDNLTLGEELERLKEPKDNESWPAAVSFADFCEGFIAYSKAMREAQK